MNYYSGSQYKQTAPVTPFITKPVPSVINKVTTTNKPTTSPVIVQNESNNSSTTTNRSGKFTVNHGVAPTSPEFVIGQHHLSEGTKFGKSPQKVDRMKIFAAICSFTLALESEPEHIVILGRLGFCHFLLGEYVKSFSFYKRATALDPENPLCEVYYNDMGTACLKLGDIQGAYFYYGQAIELIEKQAYRSEQSSYPFKNRALLNKRNHFFKEALDDIEKAIAIEGKYGSNYPFYQKVKDEICWASGLTPSV